MDRKALREFTHKAENFVAIDSTNYKQWVFRYTFLELEKDLGTRGDLTTDGIFHDRREARAKVVAKSAGVFAGRDEIKYFLVDADPTFRPSIKGELQVDFNFADGDRFSEGDELLIINGDIRDILRVERVVMNLLVRMSSVATFTSEVVDTVKDYDVLIAPTRKTLWGLLDKRAVLIGGGGTHRINLADAILIKENHLDLYSRDFRKVLENISSIGSESRFVEIEVMNIEEVVEAGRALSEMIEQKKIRSIGIILMDNMEPLDISKALNLVKEEGLYDNLLFEASGGVSADNVVTYAKTGVDIISMGCLTAGVKTVDLSMKIV